MQEVLTRQEKANLLITRAARLKVFVDKLGERGRPLIEAEAYLILEVFEPRSRAILRYARRAFKQWRHQTWFNIEFGVRMWWYRKVKGLELEDALNLACDVINQRVSPTQRGGGNGTD